MLAWGQRGETAQVSGVGELGLREPRPSARNLEPSRCCAEALFCLPGNDQRYRGRPPMDRIWLKNNPAGVPADIDPARYSSLVALFEESFAKYRNADAYVCMDKTLTYGQLDEMSSALAGWLQGRGLARGDRVAIMMPNALQYPVCVAGILRAGCVVVNVNPLYTPRELEQQLKDSGAKA